MENLEQAQPPSCKICGTHERLLRCAKCKMIYYCSVAHQHIDWPTHRGACRNLARMRDYNKMQQLQQAVDATTLNNTRMQTRERQALAEAMQRSNANMQHTRQNTYNGFALDNVLVGGASANTLDVDSDVLLMNAVSPRAVMMGNANGIRENMNTQTPAVVSQQGPQSVYANAVDMQELQCDSVNGAVAMDEAAGGMPAQTFANPTNATLLTPINNAGAQQQQSQQQLPLMQQLPQVPHQHYQQFPHNNPNHNSQNEKTFSCQLGSADENAFGSANEQRYDDLCRNIINDMNQYGLSVVDDFLGMEKGLQILNEVHRMYAAGVFQDGQLVNNIREEELRTIRGDKITWVKGVEAACTNVGYLINQIDAVICRANSMHNNGKLGNYNIKERTKAMVACYPGSGSHYVVHVDNPNKDGRVITAIYYLNVNWDTRRNGGVLRIFPEHGNAVADIEPKFDRLIFFWSDKRNPHEVQPAHRTRYAITVWYFDADEREIALNRVRDESNAKATAKATEDSNCDASMQTNNANNSANTNNAIENVQTNANTNITNANANPVLSTNTNANTLALISQNSSEICT